MKIEGSMVQFGGTLDPLQLDDADALALTEMVPARRVELPTFALRMRCSTN